MKIRSLVVLLTVVLALFLTGCWDLDELEDTSFIEVLGIDSAPGGDELVLTAEVVLPTSALAGAGGMGGGATGGPQDFIIQAKGRTLNMALNELREIMVRKAFTGYIGFVIIGERAARKDMPRILEFFDRNPPLRRSAFVMVTPGKASDVMTTINPRGTVLNKSLMGILKRTEQTGVAFSARMGNDIFEPLAVAGIEPIATRIVPRVFPPEAQGGGGMGGAAGGMGAVGFPNSLGEPVTLARKMGDHQIEGMAVFKGARLVGWLDEKESRGWGWIKGKMRRGVTVVLEPRGARGDSDPVTFRYVEGKSSIKLSLEGEQVTALVTIKMKGEVAEWGASRDLIDPKIIRSLEADMAARVKDDVDSALEKAQWELGSDIFGFGFSLFRQHQREWKTKYKDSWDEIFPTMPVEVKVEAQITNTGPVIRAFKLKP